MHARPLDHHRLRQWRAEAGLSAEAAATLAGISYPYLRALEAGRRTPSLAVLARIADAYSKPPGELICGPQSHLRAEPEAAAS